MEKNVVQLGGDLGATSHADHDEDEEDEDDDSVVLLDRGLLSTGRNESAGRISAHYDNIYGPSHSENELDFRLVNLEKTKHSGNSGSFLSADHIQRSSSAQLRPTVYSPLPESQRNLRNYSLDNLALSAEDVRFSVDGPVERREMAVPESGSVIVVDGQISPDKPLHGPEMPSSEAPEPSASSAPRSRQSSIRSLVRSLTPKKRLPKPILVKAGFHRDGPDEPHRVTFDTAQQPTSDSTPSSTNKPVTRISWRCCGNPVLGLAGGLSLIGGISFGYDVGIMSGMLQPVRDHFHLTCVQEQVLVGCLIGGALIVSICGGQWIDKCGRRRAILISSTFFIFGSCLSALAPNLDALAAGRLLQGFGMSMAAIAECIYVSELAPKENRGFMVGLNEIGITLGFVLAFLAGFALHGAKDSWRIMMGLGAAPAVIQFLGTFFLLPPSPREKMMNKCDREAILILEHLRGNRNDAMNEFAAIRHSLVIEESYGTLTLFKSADNMLFRMLIGFSLVFLQQISGQPNILYYASAVFTQVGFSSRYAALAAFGLGVIKVVATVAALAVCDKRGRRFFLVLGCLLMSGSLAVVAISSLISPPTIEKVCHGFRNENLTFPVREQEWNHHQIELSKKFLQQGRDELVTENGFGVEAVMKEKGTHIAQLVFNLAAMMVYVAGYSISFGPMVWLVLSELYPAGVKGRAMSMANIVNWATSLLVSLTFLQTMTVLTVGGTFMLFSIVNLFSALYIYLVVPETRAKSLERISYELRTTRPKQRFDENLANLFPRWKKRSTETVRPSTGSHSYSRVRDAA